MAVKIATPISTLVVSPKDAEALIPFTDAWELRDRIPDIRSDLPRLYHCELSLINSWRKGEAQATSEFIKAHKIEMMTLHLLACYSDPAIVGGQYQPRGEKMSEERMLENAAQNLADLRKAGCRIPCGVENNNFFPTGAYDIVTEPDFINLLLEREDLFLLVDLSHAEITAHNRGIALGGYLGELNADKVRQIHLSGLDRAKPVYEDTHETLGDVDWKNFQAFAARCPQLEYVTIEYYKDRAKLVEMLKKLNSLIK